MSVAAGPPSTITTPPVIDGHQEMPKSEITSDMLNLKDDYKYLRICQLKDNLAEWLSYVINNSEPLVLTNNGERRPLSSLRGRVLDRLDVRPWAFGQRRKPVANGQYSLQPPCQESLYRHHIRFWKPRHLTRERVRRPASPGPVSWVVETDLRGSCLSRP